MTLRAEAVASALLFGRVAHAALYAILVGFGIGVATTASVLSDPSLTNTLVVSAVGLVAVDALAVRPSGWYLKRSGA